MPRRGWRAVDPRSVLGTDDTGDDRQGGRSSVVVYHSSGAFHARNHWSASTPASNSRALRRRSWTSFASPSPRAAVRRSASPGLPGRCPHLSYCLAASCSMPSRCAAPTFGNAGLFYLCADHHHRELHRADLECAHRELARVRDLGPEGSAEGRGRAHRAAALRAARRAGRDSAMRWSLPLIDDGSLRRSPLPLPLVAFLQGRDQDRQHDPVFRPSGLRLRRDQRRQVEHV